MAIGEFMPVVFLGAIFVILFCVRVAHLTFLLRVYFNPVAELVIAGTVRQTRTVFGEFYIVSVNIEHGVFYRFCEKEKLEFRRCSVVLFYKEKV